MGTTIKKIIYETKWVARDSKKKYPHGWGFVPPLVEFPADYDVMKCVKECKKLSNDEFECYGAVPRQLLSVGLFDRLKSYAGKYQISIQLWGNSANQIYISKDDVELWSCGGEKTPEHAIKKALKYLDRINHITTP